MRKAVMAGLMASALGAGLIAVHASGQPLAAGGEEAVKCAAMAQVNPMGAASASAKWVDADPKNGLAAFCEVSATLSPVEGSKIGVVYRLPIGWNGKMLGLGGGGWAGNITLMAATPGLKKGYATAQTDGGHPSTSPWNTDWTVSPEAVTDFSYRAINQMTVAAKKLIAAYYGKAQDKAYFHGCSTGGRMALMEAQRFPNDYDAIISEAPVYTLQVQTSAVLRNKVIAAGGGFSAEQLKLVNDSVIKACDARDGLADGIIASPRMCNWSPKALVCPAGENPGATCLGPKQVDALETLYAGIKAPGGSWAMLPLNKGGETLWSVFIKTDGTGTDQASGGGMPGLSHLLFGDRKVDFAQLDPNTDVPEARASAFARMYEATSPNLSAFFGHGGKLIMWHGQSDPGPSPVATLDYFKAVQKDNPAAANDLRLFLAPGVSHCRGGPGADVVDNLDNIDQWVETGKAPERIIARKADGSMTRPLCAWPKMAHYRGSGDPDAPGNYTCEVPAKD